jgi:CRISPR-associated protein Csb1
VPQVVIKLKEGHELNLLDAGHRAADAVVRFSKEFGPALHEAFEQLRDNQNCTPLARMAPTSLVFGVWDSRGTQIKSPRIVRSIIRAYNVKDIKRSATYRAAYEYTDNGIIKPELDVGSGKKNPVSQEGLKFSLATNSHGGVRVMGELRQEALINLVALRSLTDDLDLRRYLWGLAALALSYRDPKAFNLREGCLLKAASSEDSEGRWQKVFADGRPSESIPMTHQELLECAKAAAKSFGVVDAKADEFDQETAEAWLQIDKKERRKIAKKMHPQEAVRNRNASRKASKSPAKESAQDNEEAKK